MDLDILVVIMMEWLVGFGKSKDEKDEENDRNDWDIEGCVFSCDRGNVGCVC